MKRFVETGGAGSRLSTSGSSTLGRPFSEYLQEYSGDFLSIASTTKLLQAAERRPGKLLSVTKRLPAGSLCSENMKPSFEEPNSSTELTSGSVYQDDTTSQNGPHTSASEPLLEDAHRSFDSITSKKISRWRALFSRNYPSRARWKHLAGDEDIEEKAVTRSRIRSRKCWNLVIGVLVFLYLLPLHLHPSVTDTCQSGIVQIFSLVGSLVFVLSPDEIHRILGVWGRPGYIGAGLSSWPTDFSRDILPIPCHSHNDYWRTVPLFSAIEAGCIGVEADIWLYDEELYVGHSVASLAPNRTLNSLYIDPLLDILSKQNPQSTLLPDNSKDLHGVFDTTPEQSLIFLIDFKTAGKDLWPYLNSALDPLRAKNYLTYSNGSQIISGVVTVVGTGNTPFDRVISDDSNPYHDIFFDAPLDDMYEDDGPKDEDAQVKEPLKDEFSTGDGTKKINVRQPDEAGQGKSGVSITAGPEQYTASNSYYASVAFGKAIGHLADGRFSNHQLDVLRGQIRGAHKRGLKARYWDLPFWPISLRNHVWDVLVKEGVDLLNVDDLKGATRRNWDEHHG